MSIFYLSGAYSEHLDEEERFEDFSSDFAFSEPFIIDSNLAKSQREKFFDLHRISG